MDDSACAMKVGTDSILLGSWAARCLDEYPTSEQYLNGLDIGAGSGLLALMLSQWAAGKLRITAVEIDADAARQANQNVAASPWPDSIEVVNSDIVVSNNTLQSTFDVIVSNPPYFSVPHGETRSQQGFSNPRKVARSETALTLSSLFAVIRAKLSTKGLAFIVLPTEQAGAARRVSEQHGLCVQRQLEIRSLPEKPVSRLCLAYGLTQTTPNIDKLNIYAAPNVYTEEYRALCRAYYLHF
ncbi:methyltransferase [Alteromonas sp. ASW11-36]|uniref:Methyltransferase n=1 Tax=Alteromonas arenosi TaxID=3055817 RepID=A0ABT7SZ39_9ALTE|nr:methyltransferase [Alteromonas sp. ASW11-36]MDM7861459.1 methyltransferase [Alteromonas sp. ASW11-36]